MGSHPRHIPQGPTGNFRSSMVPWIKGCTLDTYVYSLRIFLIINIWYIIFKCDC